MRCQEYQAGFPIRCGKICLFPVGQVNRGRKLSDFVGELVTQLGLVNQLVKRKQLFIWLSTNLLESPVLPI